MRTSRTTTSTALALAALAATPAAADASRTSVTGFAPAAVTVAQRDEPTGPPGAPAHQRYELFSDADGRLVIRVDRGEVSVAGACTLQGIRTVVCPPASNRAGVLRVHAGAGDDTISLAGLRAVSGYTEIDVDGGPGDDRITGGELGETLRGGARHGDGSPITDLLFGDGDDVIDGGPGADVIFGNAGADVIDGLGVRGMTETAPNVLDGGPGNDVLHLGSTLGPDTVSGGSGLESATPAAPVSLSVTAPPAQLVALGDLVTYEARETAGVTVTIDDRADDGAPGERDNIRTDVESVRGTPQDDAITGSTRANVLDGGRGVDRLVGFAGPDHYLLRDGVRDACPQIDIGDTVDADLLDPTVSECRRARPDARDIARAAELGRLRLIRRPVDERTPAVGIGRLRPARDGALTLAVTCPKGAPRACSGSLTLRAGKATARGRYRAPAGRTARVRIARAGGFRGMVRIDARWRGTSSRGMSTVTAFRAR